MGVRQSESFSLHQNEHVTLDFVLSNYTGGSKKATFQILIKQIQLIADTE